MEIRLWQNEKRCEPFKHCKIKCSHFFPQTLQARNKSQIQHSVSILSGGFKSHQRRLMCYVLVTLHINTFRFKGTQHRELSSVLYDNLQGQDLGRGGREAQEGGDICIHIANSRCCMAETNTTL